MSSRCTLSSPGGLILGTLRYRKRLSTRNDNSKLHSGPLGTQLHCPQLRRCCSIETEDSEPRLEPLSYYSKACCIQHKQPVLSSTMQCSMFTVRRQGTHQKTVTQIPRPLAEPIMLTVAQIPIFRNYGSIVYSVYFNIHIYVVYISIYTYMK